MIRKVFYLGVLALAMGASQLVLGATAVLRQIALSVTPQGAQITLDLSDATQQKIFRLNKPDRAVIDLGHTQLARGVRAPAGDGLVQDIHTGTQPGGTLRLVIRLKSPVSARTAWVGSDNGVSHRLMIILGQGAATDSNSTALKVVRPAHAPGS